MLVDKLSKKVGHRIKQIRESKNIKQYVLAEKLMMEPSNLTRIENGYQFPKEENLIKIASLLNVELKDLFDFDSQESPESLKEKIYDILENLNQKEIRFVYDFLKLYEARKY